MNDSNIDKRRIPGWTWLLSGMVVGGLTMFLVHLSGIRIEGEKQDVPFSIFGFVITATHELIFITIIVFSLSFYRYYRIQSYLRLLILLMSGMPVFIFMFAILYTKNGLLGADNVIVQDIDTSIYFSAVTWTTLGYGDFRPTENVRLWASMEAILGYLYMGILIGIVTQVVSNAKEKMLIESSESKGSE